MPQVPPRRAGRIAFAVSFVGMMMMFAHKWNDQEIGNLRLAVRY